MMTKTTAALMSVVDIRQNIEVFHCFSAHVHTILCYDVILVKAQLCMLHVLLCDVISRGNNLLIPEFVALFKGQLQWKITCAFCWLDMLI